MINQKHLNKTTYSDRQRMSIDQILLLQNNDFASSSVKICGIDLIRLLDNCERVDQTNIAKLE